MASLGGKRLTQNASDQQRKAEQLEALVQRIVNKMDEIDEEIINLVEGGMEGKSVQTMANTYIENRDVISQFVKRFAAIACVVHESAEQMMKVEEEANTAAMGGIV